MTLRAEILAIGDELVHGQITDTNSGYLARELEHLGVDVTRFVVVSDEPKAVEDAIRTACRRVDLVVATGGLGPTEDDRTRNAVAAVAGDELVFDADVYAEIESRFVAIKRQLSPSNRRQAERPASARVLQNQWGTAPGFALRIEDCELFAFPGVPRELRPMVQQHLLPFVLGRGVGRSIAFARLHVVGPSESVLGEKLADFMLHDRNPRVGITAQAGVLSVRIAGVAASLEEASAMCEATAAEVRPLVAEHLVCEGDDDLPVQVGKRLLDGGLTFATAESCTGGLVSELLTAMPGISAAFLGGFVTYHRDAKVRDLDVPRELIDAHGEVSEPVARAMAEGAVARTGARIAVSITGIAGPGGGTPDKPVGTVCFGLSLDGEVRAWTRRLAALDREFIRRRAAIEVFAEVVRAIDSRS